MQKIGLNQKFTLVFKVKKVDLLVINKLMDENKFITETWVQTPYNGIVEYRVNVNLRQAEIVRQLIKNTNTYD